MAAWLLLAPHAAAHPDTAVVDGTLSLAPGQARAFPMLVHFHRLVATYRVADGGSVALELRPGANAGGGEAAFTTLLRGEGRLHHLVECCFDVDFSDYTLILRNDGAAPALLDLRAWIVHDDFAVVAHAAEVGALEVPGALFLGLGLTALVVGGRARRRPLGALGTPGGSEARSVRALRWSAGLFVAALLGALTLGAAGALRYGAGLVTGMVAIMADLPVPGGPFGSRAALVMSLLLLTWIAAVALWIVAVRAGRPRGVVTLGVALCVVHMAGGVALGWTYGAWWVPLGLAAALVVPLAVGVLGVARAGSEGPDERVTARV